MSAEVVQIKVRDTVSFKKVGTESRAQVEELRTEPGLLGIQQAFLRSNNHEWDPRWMDVSDLTFVSRSEPMSEIPYAEDAMLEIQALLDRKIWTPDTLDEIAKIMRKAGYDIRDTEDHD